MTAPIGNSATPGAALNSALGTPPTKPPSAELDKDAFLKLLVAQLKYQDPLNPAQGTEFVAQTAQFTTVEKLTDLAEVQQQMLTAQLTLGAANLVGKDVTYNDANGNPVSGKVEGATLGTNPSVTVNGLSIPMSSVIAIGKPGLATTSPVPGGSQEGSFTPIGDAVPGATTPPGGAPPPASTTPVPGAPATPTAPTVPNTGTTTGSPTPTTATPTTPPGPTPSTPGPTTAGPTTPGAAPAATTPGA